MCRMMFGLREIRSSIESLPPEAEVQPSTVFSLVNVPSGYEINANGGFTPIPLTIEHQPQPPLRVDERQIAVSNANLEPPIEPSPSLSALEEKLLGMSHDELLKLARELNVGE